MENGGVSVDNRTRYLEVEEFDVSRGQFLALRHQSIKADSVLLSDKLREGYFDPLHEKLAADFCCSDSFPVELISRSIFIDGMNTQASYHNEKRYDKNAVVDYPMSIFNW